MSIVDLFYKRAIGFKPTEEDIGIDTYNDLIDNHPSIDDVIDSKAKADADAHAEKYKDFFGLTGDTAIAADNVVKDWAWKDSVGKEQSKINKKDFN